MHDCAHARPHFGHWDDPRYLAHGSSPEMAHHWERHSGPASLCAKEAIVSGQADLLKLGMEHIVRVVGKNAISAT